MLLKIHRWTGLGLAGILIIIGLTGGLLAFLEEFENALNPEYEVASTKADVFNPLALRDDISKRFPDARINSLPLYVAPNEALHLWIELPNQSNPKEMILTDLVLNPYTTQELSRRTTDIWPIKRNNLMAFIYRLHYSLLLGDTGLWICGLTALLWTLDCFVGFYLTLPRFTSSTKSWWLRWKPSWLIRADLSNYRLNFDLHRAFGLWVFLILSAFAWSGVSFNLGTQVYQPIMKALFDMPSPVANLQPEKNLNQNTNLGWSAAYALGKKYMVEQSNLHHFIVKREQSLDFDLNGGLFHYTVLSNKDVSERWGATEVSFDATDGHFVSIKLPTGSNAGTTLTTWISALHTASFWRWPLQIFVSLIGFIVAMLSVTGVYIWIKKHNARRFLDEKRAIFGG